SPGSVTVFVSRATDSGTAQPHVPLPVFSGTAAVDAVFAAATRGVTPTAAAGQNGPGSQAGVSLNLAAPVPAILSGVATRAAAVWVGTDQDSTGEPVPGVRPPSPRMESGNGAALDDDASEPAGVLLPTANAADALLWQRASFAGDSWAADQADTV